MQAPRIVYFAKGDRGALCLEALLDHGYCVDLVVTQPKQGRPHGVVADVAQARGLPVEAPEDPNLPDFRSLLASRQPDLFILGGYGPIIRPPLIAIPRLMTINLHGGKLPEYRGSSPLNWVLIKGETSFGISIIQVDSGVDTGPILLDRQFAIGPDTTVAELHALANREFPLMLLEVLRHVSAGTLSPRPQSREAGAYWPLRFPEDGFFLWDSLTATEVHNLVRGLTEPYPCARTSIAGRLVRVIATQRHEHPFHGVPGRIYRKTNNGLLTCASDRCLWITRAVFDDTGEDLIPSVKRYDCFDTVRHLIARNFSAIFPKATP